MATIPFVEGVGINITNGLPRFQGFADLRGAASSSAMFSPYKVHE
jgi:hypothetical protein